MIQKELIEFAQEHEIVVMAYMPFGPLVSRYGMELPPPKIDDPVLVEIAKKYGKTTPQVVLRWLVSTFDYLFLLVVGHVAFLNVKHDILILSYF